MAAKNIAVRLTTNDVINNKRISRNTLFLYCRMLFVMLISLYTSRIVLKILGVEDYGIYNIVGSIVGFMNLITGSMISATQRFLAYDLGKGDMKHLQSTFSMLINVFAIFCLISLLVLESIGPYFIMRYLVIPPARLAAAQWVFQFSVLSFIISTLIIPYSSSIIAYEKLGVFAYFTLIDVTFKLLAVFALFVVPADHLITLGAVTIIMSFTTNGAIYWYCVKKLMACRYKRIWDKSLFKKIFTYSGWNLLGSTTSVMNTQGQAILLNIFFGPAVNAAKGIADRINSVVSSFCSNFYMAVNPQIIKTYAAGETDYTKKLVLKSSKLAFYMMLMLSLPLIFNMDELLTLWLGKEQVSSEMICFSQWVLVYAIISTLEGPITQVIRATGDLKKYQIQVGCQTLLFIPIIYVLFKCGYPPYSSMIVLSGLYFIVQFTRVRLLGFVLEICMSEYISKVLLPVVGVSTLSFIILHFTTIQIQTDIQILLLNLTQAVVIVCLIVYLLGLSKAEKAYLHNLIFRHIFSKR